jgi:hypothetical protein
MGSEPRELQRVHPLTQGEALERVPDCTGNHSNKDMSIAIENVVPTRYTGRHVKGRQYLRIVQGDL